MILNRNLIIRVLNLVETLDIGPYELHATEDTVTVLYESRMRVFPYENITTELTLKVETDDIKQDTAS